MIQKVIVFMSDFRQKKEEYRLIAQDLINTEPELAYIKNSQVRRT